MSMAGSVAGNTTGLGRPLAAPRRHRLHNRKIWLPKLVYDALPWFYLGAGIAAFAATIYIGDWYWVVPHSLLVSGACIHLALYLFIRRRRNDA